MESLPSHAPAGTARVCRTINKGGGSWLYHGGDPVLAGRHPRPVAEAVLGARGIRASWKLDETPFCSAYRAAVIELPCCVNDVPGVGRLPV
jgi:hypothetical protein